MKLMKKLTALLMALCLLLPGAVLAEDEEISILDVVEEVNLDEGEKPAEDAEDAEGGEELFISDEVQEAMEAVENLEADIDDSINPDDLELNPNLPDNVVNILLVGVDTRSTTLDDGLQHGDVQIILSINKDTGSVKLTSILRDLYVTIPGYKSKNRINVAYARGGGALAMRTINHTFEMNIEHYVTINF